MCLQALAERSLLPDARLWPVHRLDTPTSGILLMARSKADAATLARLFHRRQVVKYYVALTGRRPARKQGTVIGDMARTRRKAWKLLRACNNPAVTRFVSRGLPGVPLTLQFVVGTQQKSWRLARQGSAVRAAGLEPLGTRLMLLKPETGRTHQLRVACKSLGCPITGDELYGDAAEAAAHERCYLHAAAIRVPPLGPGEAPLQVVCNPADVGSHQANLFSTSVFQHAFDELFPIELVDDFKEWFSNEPKWMRSSLGFGPD